MAHSALQELRLRIDTAMSTSFVAANTGSWSASNASVLKLRVVEVAKDGLVHEAIQNATIQTRLRGAPAPFPGRRQGTLKVTTYLGGGSATTTPDPYATLAGAIMGSLATPTSKTYTIGSGSNASNIVCTPTGLANGAGVLINGEARIATTVAPTYVLLNMALASAPSNGQTMVAAHSAYFDENATQKYIDWLAVGATTEDQRQGIGAQSTLEFAGLAPGEAPQMKLEISSLDWQHVPAGERTSLSHGVASAGNNPPTGYQYGGIYIADAGSQVARATMRAGQFEISTGIAWSPLSWPNGPNGLGGWLRDPHRPTMSLVVAYGSDMPGLYDDFTAGTAKQVLLQLGTTQGRCVAFWFPKFLLDASPVDAALNNEAGLKIVGHGDDNYTTDGELRSSALSVHWF